MQIVNADGVLNNVVRVIVGLSITDARLDAPASNLHAETTWMVITAVVGHCQLALAVHGSPKLASP